MAEAGAGSEAQTGRRPATQQDTGCSDQERFALELEFVQCLANPHYLNWLAQHRYFEDQAFVGYLAYLQYWRQPKYSQYLVYPHALFFLDMLQSAAFRSSLARNDVADFLHSTQFYFWQHHRRNELQRSAQQAVPS